MSPFSARPLPTPVPARRGRMRHNGRVNDQEFKNKDAAGNRLPTVGEVISRTTDHEPDELGH